jgi:hypothetical protein
MLQENWNLTVGWVQAPGVGEAEAAHCRNVGKEASVVVKGGSNVEPIGCIWRPGRSRSWIIAYQCFGPQWGQGCLVEIKTTVDFLVG